jgi:hypothetical protein
MARLRVEIISKGAAKPIERGVLTAWSCKWGGLSRLAPRILVSRSESALGSGHSSPGIHEFRKTVSVDFFVVPTIRFQILYVFLVLAHERRRILHFAVTARPTAKWTAQQMREAFPWDTAPRYLRRDRDRIFGHEFVKQVMAMGVKQVLSAPR